MARGPRTLVGSEAIVHLMWAPPGPSSTFSDVPALVTAMRTLRRAPWVRNRSASLPCVALHDHRLPKRPPHPPHPVCQVMLKHIDLCVETKSGRKCKDALINYRNTVQGMNVGSLELVIDHLITTASARAEQAQQAAQVLVGAGWWDWRTVTGQGQTGLRRHCHLPPPVAAGAAIPMPRLLSVLTPPPIDARPSWRTSRTWRRTPRPRR